MALYLATNKPMVVSYGVAVIRMIFASVFFVQIKPKIAIIAMSELSPNTNNTIRIYLSNFGF